MRQRGAAGRIWLAGRVGARPRFSGVREAMEKKQTTLDKDVDGGPDEDVRRRSIAEEVIDECSCPDDPTKLPCALCVISGERGFPVIRRVML